MYGKRIDTGDRAIIFKRINVNIPSYIFVRGWRAFVNYIGQLRTCRVYGCTGHLAKACPRLKKESEPANDQPVSSEPEDMESEPIRTPEPTRTFEEPTSIPTLQETLKEFFGQDLNVESSPPPQVSDEDDLVREGLSRTDFFDRVTD